LMLGRGAGAGAAFRFPSILKHGEQMQQSSSHVVNAGSLSEKTVTSGSLHFDRFSSNSPRALLLMIGCLPPNLKYSSKYPSISSLFAFPFIRMRASISAEQGGK